VDSQDTLAYLDSRGTGRVSVSDVKTAIHQLRLMRKLAVLLIVLVVVLLVGMFGTSFVAVRLSMEVRVQKGMLVDTDSRGLSTFRRLDTISGLQVRDRRRLSEAGSNVTSSNITDLSSSSDADMQISSSFFKDTRDQYITGRTDWVVQLPDGTSRTINIQGAEAHSAWGECGSCLETLMWTASCPPDSDAACPITWKSTSGSNGNNAVRRLLSQRRQYDVDKGRSFERSLESKQCF
jgi:hypothetical protein